MIPREVYTLGAVRFDSRPVAQLQGQLLAKKAAKEEALDKYFQDLKMKINPAGMRTQDVPGFNEKLTNWISSGIANKSSIAKGGLAQQDHLLKYQELLNDVEQSKQIGKLQMDLDSKRQEGKLDEEDFPILDRIGKTIYDPLHYKNVETKMPFSMGDFSENIPTWDVPKRKQFIDFAAAGVAPAGKVNEKVIIDPYTKRKITTFDKVYTQDQLMKMAEKAIAIGSDRSGLKTYKKILQEGERDVPSDEFISLAKAYSSINPNDAMDTPLKVAAADIILNKMGVAGRGETSYAKPGAGTTINLGGTAGETVRDLYKDVKRLSDAAAVKNKGAALNEVPSSDAQIRLLEIAKKVKNDSNLSQEDIFLRTEPDGRLWIYEVTERDDAGGAIGPGKRVAVVKKEDLEIPFQPGVAEEREVISQAKKEEKKPQAIKSPVKVPAVLKGIPKGGF